MEDHRLVSSLDSQNEDKSKKYILIIISVLVVILGSALGVFFSSKSLENLDSSQISDTRPNTTPLVVGEVGSSDPIFKDTATGKLASGGQNGEGTHQLVRPGGPSQTVYLVSSVVDLDQYVGKQVQVTGQTLQARKVGWLMDVGRLKTVSE